MSLAKSVFEDEFVQVDQSSSIFAHVDSSFRVKVKGTKYSFSSVAHRVMPYYLKLPAIDAILVPTWSSHDYNITFHLVYLKTNQHISIFAGKLYFGTYSGYKDLSKINDANYVESVNDNELVLVCVGETLAEGRFKEITTLDLKAQKLKKTLINSESKTK